MLRRILAIEFPTLNFSFYGACRDTPAVPVYRTDVEQENRKLSPLKPLDCLPANCYVQHKQIVHIDGQINFLLASLSTPEAC